MARSTFSTLGLPIGQNNTNMAYLYGISDFFATMFTDYDKINLLLEVDTEMYSQVYSRFLQLSANISLEEIQETYGVSIHLVTINDTDIVTGLVNTYTLPESVVSARYIANLPLLPTTLLEQSVDYGINQAIDGSYQITFAKDMTSNGFSSRLLSDGATTQFALWFVDAEIDEEWISTYYGDLIGVSPEASTQTFQNFVYGLYYLYTNGPTLDLLRKGLNLALGIPLCRGTETVLDIRTYLETDQYIVITDQNQYVIPYGLPPIVSVGQVLTISQEVAQWVEVEDYDSAGAWWINLQIPTKFIPSLPPGQANRYATAGSQFDYLMRNYLKTHTFLVNVNVATFKDTQLFQQLSDIIKRAKPTYTDPIYIWTVEQDDTLTLNDSEMGFGIQQNRCENLTRPIYEMNRNNTVNPLNRGCPTFIRFNVPNSIQKLCGTDVYQNGLSDSFNGGNVIGYVNPINQYRNNTPTERSWIRAIMDRGSEVVTGNRDQVGFYRGINATSDLSFDWAGVPVETTARLAGVAGGLRIIPLYITTQQDIIAKFTSLGLQPPSLSQWTFNFLYPYNLSLAINALAINYNLPVDIQSLNLANNFNLGFFRGTNIEYLGAFMPDSALNETWAPPDATSVNTGDFILGVRIYGNTVGMYWVTSNFNIQPPYYYPVKSTDDLILSFNNVISRGVGPLGSPYYLLRGRGFSGTETGNLAINENVIDGTISNPTIVIVNTYADTLNTTPINFTRDGTQNLNHEYEST